MFAGRKVWYGRVRYGMPTDRDGCFQVVFLFSFLFSPSFISQISSVLFFILQFSTRRGCTCTGCKILYLEPREVPFAPIHYIHSILIHICIHSYPSDLISYRTTRPSSQVLSKEHLKNPPRTLSPPLLLIVLLIVLSFLSPPPPPLPAPNDIKTSRSNSQHIPNPQPQPRPQPYSNIPICSFHSESKSNSCTLTYSHSVCPQ